MIDTSQQTPHACTRHTWLLAASLVLLPLVWLWPCIGGDKSFVPFDPAQFPPAAMTLSKDQLTEARAASNLDVTEVWPWLLPEMELLQEHAGPGTLSTWNPHARTGAPLHEVGVHGLLYPPHWLWLTGGQPRDWLPWQSWLSLALAGLFTFGLLRQVGLRDSAAWFGAMTFQLSGTMAANAFFWTRLPGLAWLPALLLALLRFADGDRLRAAPLAAVAVALAMPWLPGFPPFAAAGLVIAALLAARLVLERMGREGDRAGFRLAGRLTFAFACGLLLAMPQLLPSAWFYSFEAARSANPGFEMLRSTRFDSYGLLGYLLPDAFGHPITGRDLPYSQSPLAYLWCDRFDEAGKAIAPNYNYTEYSVFAGTLAVVLGWFGAVRARGHLRWFVIVVLAVLLGLALFVPVVRWLYYLPVFKNVFAMRWLAPGSLFVAWLAAIGYDRLWLCDQRGASAHQERSERRAILRLGLLTLAVAGLTYWLTQMPASWHASEPEWPATTIAARFQVPLEGAIQHLQAGSNGVDRFAAAGARFAAAGTSAGAWLLGIAGLLIAIASCRPGRARRAFLLALPCVSVVQLALHGQALLPGQPLAQGTDTAIHEFLRERAATDQRGGFTIARAGLTPTAPLQLPPGQLLAPGIRDLHFYSHGDKRSVAPLRAVLGEEFVMPSKSYVEKILPPDKLSHPLFDLLGVRYVLAHEFGKNKLSTLGEPVGPIIEGRGGNRFVIYERPTALPRAFTVGALIGCGDDAGVLEELGKATTPHGRQAYVARPRTQPSPPTGKNRELVFVRDEPTVVELDVAAGTDPWLVLTDAWFEGWSATVDGKPVAIERCNHAQRLVALPQSRCRVRFQYTANWLIPGWLLCLIGAAGLALPLVRRRASSAVAARDETAE